LVWNGCIAVRENRQSCQVELLDGHWARQAEIVTKTLADAGSKARLAAVFSGRGDSVESFLHEVERSSAAAT
jgi:hypothetical protein